MNSIRVPVWCTCTDVVQVFTAWPPLSLGLFDRYCSAASMLRYPQLYKPSQNSEFLNVKIFGFWVTNALYHSLILFWATYLAFTQDVAFADGKIGDYLFMGNMVYTVSSQLCAC